MAERSNESHVAQVVGSIVVAVLIVVVTIAIVTAKLGPGRSDGGHGRSRSEDHSGPG